MERGELECGGVRAWSDCFAGITRCVFDLDGGARGDAGDEVASSRSLADQAHYPCLGYISCRSRPLLAVLSAGTGTGAADSPRFFNHTPNAAVGLYVLLPIPACEPAANCPRPSCLVGLRRLKGIVQSKVGRSEQATRHLIRSTHATILGVFGGLIMPFRQAEGTVRRCQATNGRAMPGC